LVNCIPGKDRKQSGHNIQNSLLHWHVCLLDEMLNSGTKLQINPLFYIATVFIYHSLKLRQQTHDHILFIKFGTIRWQNIEPSWADAQTHLYQIMTKFWNT
jgi:hypothetical protein